MTEPRITRGYIDAPAGRIYACEVAPSEGSPELGSAVLLGPFVEEKKSSRRTIHEMALACAGAGWRSLSIDFTGTGDSPGTHGELTVETMLAECAAARGYLRLETGREPALIGFRLGATVAWLSASGAPPAPAGLVLVQPVAEGGKYLWNMLRRKQVREMMTAGASKGVTAQAKEAFGSGGSFDLDGFEISSKLAEGLERVRLADIPLPGGMPSLLVGVGPKGRMPADVAALAKLLPEGGRSEALDLEPFWDRIERIDAAPLHEAVRGFLAEIRSEGGPANG